MGACKKHTDVLLSGFAEHRAKKAREDRCEDIPRRPKEYFPPLLPSTKRTLRQSSSAADQLKRLQA